MYRLIKSAGQNNNYITLNTHSLIHRLENSLGTKVDGPFKDEGASSNNHQKGGGAFENRTI